MDYDSVASASESHIDHLLPGFDDRTEGLGVETEAPTPAPKVCELDLWHVDRPVREKDVRPGRIAVDTGREGVDEPGLERGKPARLERRPGEHRQVVPELLDERPVADRQTERSVRCEEKITQALGQEAARAKESESGHRP
jgi:hypothetical protein